HNLDKKGIKIIIALTHCGYKLDKKIAKECPLVDLVVGGHSHTFLKSGKVDPIHPEHLNIRGPYPTIIVQKSGKQVPVVQAYCMSKYIGKLKLRFSKGDLIESNGDVIILNSIIPKDPEMLKMIEKYKSKVPKDEVLVRSRVKLSGWNECRVGECSIGNLLADAMAYARAKMLTKTNFPYATDASIAFLNSDGIRASIDKKSDGLIRQKDIRLVLPFKTKVFVVEMKGAGGILQMAGVKVTYNIKKPPGKRLGDDVQVLCANCEVPTYEPHIFHNYFY
uniref:5'-nucleotidase n=1 Tax=Megaselia scalaris TaxID=36166 RepID=T1H0A4_MEGSC